VQGQRCKTDILVRRVAGIGEIGKSIVHLKLARNPALGHDRMLACDRADFAAKPPEGPRHGIALRGPTTLCRPVNIQVVPFQLCISRARAGTRALPASGDVRDDEQRTTQPSFGGKCRPPS